MPFGTPTSGKLPDLRVGDHYGIHFYIPVGPEISDDDIAAGTAQSRDQAAWMSAAVDLANTVADFHKTVKPWVPAEYIRELNRFVEAAKKVRNEESL